MPSHCTRCDKYWSYEVKKCIFCGGSTEEVAHTRCKVVGFTKVMLPSKEHKKVPYFAYLLEDKNKNKEIWKSYSEHAIGEFIALQDQTRTNCTIAVIGSGQLGIGIAEHLLRNNFQVFVKTRSEQRISQIVAKIREMITKTATTGNIDKSLKRLMVTTDYTDLNGCDIVIESVSEDLAVKRDVFQRLSCVCNRTTIFATNTSALSIDGLARATDRPERVIGMHFFNPVSTMNLVEVVVGEVTSLNTIEHIVTLSEQIGKTPIVVKNSPGFIVNRLLLLQINEAVALLQEGIATKENIDQAMKLGLNHPMGPFALADFIGLDTCVSILDTLSSHLDEKKFVPAQLLRDLVKEGRLGRKTGAGFYTY